MDAAMSGVGRAEPMCRMINDIAGHTLDSAMAAARPVRADAAVPGRRPR
jgi:hypothetical protein